MAGITFVEVVDAGPRWTKVLASDGNTYTLKGDRNWRNNNPGNIEYGSYAKTMGAIGSDGRFAVFPSYDKGFAAQTVLQFESPRYKDLTVKDAIARYAPAFENDSHGYAKTVAAAAGVSLKTKMSDLTPEQRQRFLQAQQKVEGFKPGKIVGGDGKPVPAHVAQQFRAIPLPPLGMRSDAPIPANLTRGIDRQRTIYAANNVPPIPLPRRIAPAQSLMSESKAPSLADLPMRSVPDLRPGTVSAALAAARQRLAAAREAKATGGVLPVGPFPTKPGVNTGVLDVAEIKPMSQSGPQARKTIFDTGFGSLLGKSVSPSAQNPKAPVSVRVPTGPTMDPRGSGTSYAAVQKFTSSPSPTSRPTLMDSVGKGATLADLSSFNGRSGAFRTGQGIAGTVQLPANVTPQIPAIVPPKAAVFTPKAAALPPPTQTINPAMRNALTAVAPGTPMKVPPIPATRPAALPQPSAPSPAPRSNPITVVQPKPVTFQGSSSGNTYEAGRLYQSAGYVYVANPAGTFTKVGKVGQPISTSSLPRPGFSSGASLGSGTTVSRGYTPSQSLGAS